MDTVHFTCDLCDRGVEAMASAAGQRLVCPHCNGLVVVPGPVEALPTAEETDAGAAVRPMAVPERENNVARAIAWGVSLLLHLALFLSLSGVTWLSGLGTGAEGREVGIADVSEGPSIRPGDADLPPIDAPSAPLTLPQPAESQQADAITALPGTTGRAAEPIVGIAASSGGSASSMRGDWSAFVSGGGGGGGGASFFGLEARGRKFVYVVDRSSSMSGQKILAAKGELVRSISALRRSMRFFIIFYNQGPEPMQAEGLVKATEPNKQRYFAWVEDVPARGATDPTEAMRMALALKPDAVWLLSDGLFAEQAAAAIRAANPGTKVQVHTIAFYDNAGEPVLRRIAEENRGHYRFVAPSALGLRPRRR